MRERIRKGNFTILLRKKPSCKFEANFYNFIDDDFSWKMENKAKQELLQAGKVTNLF